MTSPSLPIMTDLLPVYNSGHSLDTPLQSLVRQTLTSFEGVIFDDGFRTQSPALRVEWAARDAYLRVFHRPHRRLVPTLNEPLILAQGKLLARMEPDDVAFPQRLERQFQCRSDHPTFVTAGTAVEYLAEVGPTGLVVRHPCQSRHVRRRLPRRNRLNHPTFVQRRSTRLLVGGYRTAFRHAEDYDLWLRLLAKGELANQPEVLLDYRAPHNQISQPALVQHALATRSERHGTTPTARIHRLPQTWLHFHQQRQARGLVRGVGFCLRHPITAANLGAKRAGQID
ncbi:MAG: glycosyltransferase [Phycisphaerae bacterium]